MARSSRSSPPRTTAARPPGWRLTPRAVVTFVVGSGDETLRPPKGAKADGVPSALKIGPKFVGDRALVERCVVTLAGERGLLLVGEPGTAKSMLSELLAAAISGITSLTVQGTAGTTEEQLRYGWNYALLLAQGPIRGGARAVAGAAGDAPRRAGPDRGDHPLPARGAGRAGLDPVRPPARDPGAAGETDDATGTPRRASTSSRPRTCATAACPRCPPRSSGASTSRPSSPIADREAEAALVRRQAASRVEASGARFGVDDAVLDALVTAFRDLRGGRSDEGWAVERPSTVMSTAEAVRCRIVAGPPRGVLPRRSRRALAGARAPARRRPQGRPAGPGAAARLLGRGGEAPRGGREPHLATAVGAAVGHRGMTAATSARPRRPAPRRLRRLRSSTRATRSGPRRRRSGPAAIRSSSASGTTRRRSRPRCRPSWTRPRRTALLVELPMELAPWLGWLAHPDTQAPVALSAVREDGGGLSFYPFADFSPELAAIRWAVRKGIPVEPCDLPWASSAWRGAGEGEPAGPVAATDGEAGGGGDEAASEPDAALPSAPAVEGRELAGSMHRAAGVGDPEELWDRLVEVRAAGSDPERVRRAALALGWALRRSASVVGAGGPRARGLDARADRGRRTVASRSSSGHSMHRPCCRTWSDARRRTSARPPRRSSRRSSRTRSRSSTRAPAIRPGSAIRSGSRRPTRAASTRPPSAQRAGELAVGIVARDARGGPCGGHGRRDGARAAGRRSGRGLRGHAAPGRRELVEACAAVLSQGEPLGRGRAVARAMQQVLIGARHGRLAPGTPRSGLGPHVERLLAELRLPGPGDPPDGAAAGSAALRSRPAAPRRAPAARRVRCRVRRAHGVDAALGVETLTRCWSVGWQPATAALVDLAGIHGVTLEQAAEGALRSGSRAPRAARAGSVTSSSWSVVRAAAECGLIRLTEERIRALQVSFVRDGAAGGADRRTRRARSDRRGAMCRASRRRMRCVSSSSRSSRRSCWRRRCDGWRRCAARSARRMPQRWPRSSGGSTTATSVGRQPDRLGACDRSRARGRR